MAAEGFQPPRVGLDRIYTRAGDDGTTALVGGQRVPKTDRRLDAYGTVDELNAVIGLCRAELQDRTRQAGLGQPSAAGPEGIAAVAAMAALGGHLLRVQHQLFNLGSTLATLPGDIGERQPRVGEAEVRWLESEMDHCTAVLQPLRSFVLPGPGHLNAWLHLARTVCRRAERLVAALHDAGGCGPDELRYLNRLSDALFVWSRWAAHHLGQAETLWAPDQGRPAAARTPNP